MRKYFSLAELKKNAKAKKALGVFLIVVGIFAFLTPLTPGSWLFFVGLEFLGARLLLKGALAKRFAKNERLLGKEQA